MRIKSEILLGNILQSLSVNLGPALDQAVKAITCFGNDASIVDGVYKRDVEKPGINYNSLCDLDNVNIVPPLDAKLESVKAALKKGVNGDNSSNKLYVWYTFKDSGNQSFNIIRQYNIGENPNSKRELKLCLNLDTALPMSEKRYAEATGNLCYKFVKKYNSPTITFKEVLKSVIALYIKKGDEKDGNQFLSNYCDGANNEYLRPMQDTFSSYKWGEVKCSYKKDGKQYNKIINTDFGSLWKDMTGFGLGEADVVYDECKFKYKGSEELGSSRVLKGNEEIKLGDKLFDVLIKIKNFKNMGSLKDKKFQTDILNELKNGDTKTYIGNIPFETGTDYYNNFGLKKYKNVIQFDNGNVMTFFGVPVRSDVFDGEIKKIIDDIKKKYEKKCYETAGSELVISDKNTQDEIKNSTSAEGYATKVDNNFKEVLKRKCDIYANALHNNFKSKAQRIYNTHGKTYLSGTNMENVSVSHFLDAILMMMIVTDSLIPASTVCNKMLKAGIDKDTQSEVIASILKGLLDEEKNNKQYSKISGQLSNIANKISVEKNENIKEGSSDVVFTCSCKARRTVKVYSVSGKINKNIFKDNYRFATLLPYEEPVQDVAEQDYESSNMLMVEDFIQSWMVKPKAATEKEPGHVPIEGYYDMLSGMTPYVEYSFRESCNSMQKEITENGEYVIVKSGNNEVARYKKNENNGYYKVKIVEENGTKSEKKDGDVVTFKELKQSLVDSFKTFDTVRYPYFKNLTVEDNGVKKVTLTLFDPDFGSFTYSKDNGVFSLESVIRGALKNPYYEKEQEEDNSYYDPSIDYSGGIESGYLDIKDGASKISPTNLKIRFGYTKNDNIPRSKDEDSFKKRFPGMNLKDSRWWDSQQVGSNTNVNITDIKKYIKNYEIQNQEAQWTPIDEINVEDNAGNNSANNNNRHNELGGDLSVNSMLNSPYQTTVISREYSFMIIGFNTEFTQSGIQYTIQAIESKDAVTLKTRFLQRYSELTANPEEVLYNLMHIFNEDNEGKNIAASKVKICLVEDVDDKYMRNILNMKYDFKKMKEEKLIENEVEVEDTYTAACSNKGIVYNPSYLKDITVKFGSEDAIRNYIMNRSKGNPPLYKTVAQLIDEFCASCPPKIEKKFKNVKDENGQDIISDNGNYAAKPLKWFTLEDTVNDTVYICLYYRRTKKVDKVRVYTWGPNNPTTSCVKSVNLKNANEFAVLSAVDAFKTGDGIIPRTTCMSVDGIADISNGRERKSPVGYEPKTATLAGENADAYINAYSSSMYNATLEVLGDPSLCFDGEMQPYTYPVELALLMPQNEFTRMALGGKTGKVDGSNIDIDYKSIKEIIEKNMSRFKREYNGTAWYNDTDKTIKQSMSNNQTLHEASGYYVISKLRHEINASGYNTTMELVSYPNIAADVIGGVRERMEASDKS